MKTPKLIVLLFALAGLLLMAGSIFGETVTVTNYVVKQTIQDGLATGQAFAPMFGPCGTIVSGGLTMLGAFLAAYARRRSVQLTTTRTTLEAVVAGVEAATRALDPADHQQVKRTIQSQAQINGVQSNLDAVVQEVTK